MNGQIRQKRLIILLAIALLIASLRFGLSLLGFESIPVASRRPALDSEEEPSSPGRRVRTGHSSPRPGDRIAVLRAGDLERVLGSSTPGRNPWGYVDPPARSSSIPSASPAAPDPLPPPPSASTALEAIPLPEFTLRYLGRFGPPEKQIAVFTDGRRVLNRLEGDVIDGRFVVARVGYESVDIRFVDFPDVPRPARRRETPPVRGRPRLCSRGRMGYDAWATQEDRR